MSFYHLCAKTATINMVAKLLEEFEKERERTGGNAFELSHKLVVDMGSLLAHM